MSASHSENQQNIENALLILPRIYKLAQLGDKKEFGLHQFKNKKKFHDLTKFSDLIKSLQEKQKLTAESLILMVQEKAVAWCEGKEFLAILKKLKNLNSHHEIRLYTIILKKAVDAGLHTPDDPKIAFLVNNYDAAWEKYAPYTELFQALNALNKPVSRTSTSELLSELKSTTVPPGTDTTEQKSTVDNSTNSVLAQNAIDYVRNNIKFGLTQIENNQYDLPTYLEIKKTTLAMRDLLKDPEGYPEYVNFLRVDPNYDLFEFDWRVSIYQETQRGSCSEMAELALSYVAEHALPQTMAEVFQIWGHTFLVIGRQPNSDPSDPLTWGSDSYFCDPLLNAKFKAVDYQKNLLTWYESPADKEGRCMNYTEQYNPNKHGKIHAIPTMNTTFLSQRNQADYLEQMTTAFKEHINAILLIIKDYDHEKINTFIKKYERILAEEPHKKPGANYRNLKQHFQDVLKRCIQEAKILVNELTQFIARPDAEHKSDQITNIAERLERLFRYGIKPEVEPTLKSAPF